MRLMHLSDLHIGKKVGAFSMIEDQKIILEQILEIAKNEKPQAVLISGDVYDKTTPSEAAVTLLDDFLVKLAALPDCETFVLSGNHDSAERIAFARKLIEGSGVHMSSVYSGETEPFVLTDEHGPVNIYMLPFVKPVHVRHFFPDEEIQTYTDAIACAVEHMNLDQGERNVLLSHQTVNGSIRCDSELNIGGLDASEVEPYLVFDYAALGHIHSPQDVRKNHIRYCGTPLKYSFSESDQEKSVTMVEMGEKGDVLVRTVPLKPVHDFVRIKGAYDQIIAQYANKPLDDYVEVTLTDEVEVANAYGRLKDYFPRLMSLRYDNTRSREKKAVSTVHNVRHKSAVEVFSALFETMNNVPLSVEQEEYLVRISNEVEEALKCGQ